MNPTTLYNFSPLHKQYYWCLPCTVGCQLAVALARLSKCQTTDERRGFWDRRCGSDPPRPTKCSLGGVIRIWHRVNYVLFIIMPPYTCVDKCCQHPSQFPRGPPMRPLLSDYIFCCSCGPSFWHNSFSRVPVRA